MKVAVYCRVSTEDQAESKTIENQVQYAQKYCELQGLEIYKFYLDEGISGSIPVNKRPAGRKLLEDAEKKLFDAVYVYKLDRLARTTLDILKTHDKLNKLSIALKSMTESFDTSTPSGKFFLTTLGGIAEIERSTIAERMRLGKNRAIKEGRWPGGPPPFGYKVVNKKLQINECEAETVRLIFKLYAQQQMDTVSIADYLTMSKYPTPAAARKKKSVPGIWYGSTVWSILTNSAYIGVYVYGKNKAPEKRQTFPCPAIIEGKLWEQVQTKLKNNGFNARRNAKRDYLLRGLIVCGNCGRKYCGDGSHRKGRNHYYRCTGNSSFRGKLVAKCRAKSVRADVIEKIIWDDILNYIQKANSLHQKLKEMIAAQKSHPSSANEGDVFYKLMNGKEQERKRVLALFRKGIISLQEAESQLASIESEIKILRQRQSRQSAPNSPLNQENLLNKNFADLLKQKINEADIAAKRKLISTLVDSIVIDTFRQDNRSLARATINYCFDYLAD